MENQSTSTNQSFNDDSVTNTTSQNWVQRPEIDWAANANHISPSLINAADRLSIALTSVANSISSNQKPKPDKIATLTLVLSALSLLCTLLLGTVGTYYVNNSLNSQNQRYQIQLKNLDLKNTQANLEMNCASSSCTISNNGPATAQNVSVGYTIDVIGQKWASAIDDIDKLNFNVYPTSIINKAPIKKREIYGTARGIKGNNEIIFTIDALPAQTSFYISVSPNLSSYTTYQLNRPNITVYSKNNLNDKSTIGFLLEYLDEYLGLGRLNVNATCGNCAQGTTYKSSNPYSDQEVSIPDNITTNVASSGIGVNGNPQKLQTGWYKQSGFIAISYTMPIGVGPIAIPDPLSLQVIHDDINPNILDCQPSECMNIP